MWKFAGSRAKKRPIDALIALARPRARASRDGDVPAERLGDRHRQRRQPERWTGRSLYQRQRSAWQPPHFSGLEVHVPLVLPLPRLLRSDEVDVRALLGRMRSAVRRGSDDLGGDRHLQRWQTESCHVDQGEQVHGRGAQGVPEALRGDLRRRSVARRSWLPTPRRPRDGPSMNRLAEVRVEGSVVRGAERSPAAAQERPESI